MCVNILYQNPCILSRPSIYHTCTFLSVALSDSVVFLSLGFPPDLAILFSYYLSMTFLLCSFCFDFCSKIVSFLLYLFAHLSLCFSTDSLYWKVLFCSNCWTLSRYRLRLLSFTIIFWSNSSCVIVGLVCRCLFLVISFDCTLFSRRYFIHLSIFISFLCLLGFVRGISILSLTTLSLTFTKRICSVRIFQWFIYLSGFYLNFFPCPHSFRKLM